MLTGLFFVEEIGAGTGVADLGALEAELHGVAAGALDERQYPSRVPRIDLGQPHPVLAEVILPPLSDYRVKI